MSRWVVKLVAAMAVFACSPAMARDYGQQGAVFSVLEQDLLETIEFKLKALQANGGIDRMNRALAERTERKVRRPDPVAGISLATRERTWTYDPSMVMDHEVRDKQGNIIARAGQRVNPLELLVVRQAMVFIDGDDPAQMNWALKRYTAFNAKLIMVKGAPLDSMTRHQRRFYFDQGGTLVERFGIKAVPAVVEQHGMVMRVREIPVPLQRGS